ncbi:hypothetical protein EJ08DRAFT_665928 [Tothia fuscella]|uniref:Uncharacterized protein n=1 Tax=Tothia fuscella TaxID=1048955 RepID=A0A9P4NG04_9PEZI|nr:hypothetical protein EJ08DRAFT_665928 [Tothia fuscella]
MLTRSLLVVPGMLLHFSQVVAGPLPTSASTDETPAIATSVPDVRMLVQAYTPQCNFDKNIIATDIWDCYAYLVRKGNTPCVASPNARFCQLGSVKISGTSIHGGTTQSSCRNVAMAVSQIWKRCKDDSFGSMQYFGGSDAAIDNGDLIVHAQTEWVEVRP